VCCQKGSLCAVSFKRFTEKPLIVETQLLFTRKLFVNGQIYIVWLQKDSGKSFEGTLLEMSEQKQLKLTVHKTFKTKNLAREKSEIL
jgi:hypothetical protein